MKNTVRKLWRSIKYRFRGGGRIIERTQSILPHPYYIRPGTSDPKVERDIFSRENTLYGPDDFPPSPRWIIDAGANTGLRSIWFAARFPEATIVAVEPEHGNFEMLRRNTRPYPNIRCIEAGLWKSDSFLRIADSLVNTWAFQIEEIPKGEELTTDLRGVTVESLMRDFGMKTVDILKIDIEGSEKEVFEHSEAWIDSVDVFLVEFHDRFKERCTRSFLDAMQRFDYSFDEKTDGNVLVRRRR